MKAHPSLTEAWRLLGARKGPPSESDRPPGPSQPPRVLPGQIDIFGVTHGLEFKEDDDE
jgi:hypothetical protein